MNAVSLNNLWTYLQSLALTASNKKWLADHLYEAAKEGTVASASSHAMADGRKLLSENELPEAVRSLIGVADTMGDDDLNDRDAYYSHLAAKYA